MQQTDDPEILLQYFPYSRPRPIQKRILEILSKEWDRYDVFVLAAPTAFGKTGIAQTLVNANRSTSVITPTNMLVSQYRDEFPIPTLSRLDSYYCAEWDRPCSVTRGKLRKFCSGCECSADLATAKYRRGPGIYNYHTYLAHGLHRSTLVVDEAHNLIPHLRERFSTTIWQHDYGWSHSMWSQQQMVTWLQSLSPAKRKHKKIQLLEEALLSAVPRYVVQRTNEWFGGKGTRRGEPELRDCIRLLPVDLADQPPVFWPGLGRGSNSRGPEGVGGNVAGKVSKLVLLSATINHRDVTTLGLDKHRVLYLQCESPIPATHRPVYHIPVCSINRNTISSSTAAIAQYIEEHIRPRYPGSKGVVHATYQMARLLEEYLGGVDSPYIFHDRHNKSEVYQRWRDMPPESGAVLVACGMYEGMDLVEDAGRWQVVAKVPWPSLGDRAIAYQAEQDPEYYHWETIRTLVQAAGRICRTPTDFGDTYVLDATFSRLLREAQHLFPSWFLDALVLEESH